MKLIQSIAPTSDPVTLEEMKLFLRVLHDDDNALIGSMITQAAQSAEIIMNRQIMPSTYELYFDAIQSKTVLPRPPFLTLDSFQVFDGTIWNNVTDYELDDKATPALLYTASWPVISPGKNSVKIVYTAGYLDRSKVPESIKAWIKIQVSTYYENRESFVIGTIVSEVPNSHVDSLLNRYRVHNV